MCRGNHCLPAWCPGLAGREVMIKCLYSLIMLLTSCSFISSSMADSLSPLLPLVSPFMLELEDVLINLEVDSFSLSKVRALEFIKLCWIVSFSLAFDKVSDSSGSETSDDITVFTMLAVLNAAMVPGNWRA